jgi:UDP-GlcNAc:undecaprenyl-phosphate GlcNAc-1-phosphate transferase
VYLLAFGGAFLVAFAALPAWRKWCFRVGMVDDPGHRKIHAAPVPLAGGLAVFTGLAAPLVIGLLAVLWQTLPPDTVQPLSHGAARRAIQLAGILAGALGALLLGLADDKYELRAAHKFIGQVLIALVVALAGVRITLFVPSILFSYVITILWIVAVINAFNFMDNMNGLCGGLGALGAYFFGLKAAVAGQYLVAAAAFMGCGALAGFLPFNFPKAVAFLGDSGSHLVGYLLAVLAILPHFYSAEHPFVLSVLSPLVVLSVPLGDMAYVVFLRWRLGVPVYLGDNRHLSHRLTQRGWSPTRAVLFIWLLAALSGSLAV